MVNTQRAVARWIFAASLLFIALGVLLPWALASPLFALYRSAIERCAGVPSDTFARNPRLAATLAGITGGSIVGKWSLHAAIAWQWARGQTPEASARQLTAVGLLSWFFVDCASSLLFGAWPNVVMINGAPMLFVGLALARARAIDRSYVGERALPAAGVAASPWLVAASTLGALSGLAIAFGGASALFDPWFRALLNSGAHAALPERGARDLSLCFFGPIGGSTFGHFAMMLGVALGPARRAEPWAVPACVASIVAWALVDSSWCLASGAAFNVRMINAPATAGLLGLIAIGVARASKRNDRR